MNNNGFNSKSSCLVFIGLIIGCFLVVCVLGLLITPAPATTPTTTIAEPLYTSTYDADLNRVLSKFMRGAQQASSGDMSSMIAGTKIMRSAYTDLYTLNPPAGRISHHRGVMNALRPCDTAAALISLNGYAIDDYTLNRATRLIEECGRNIQSFDLIP
jgi:hypothetical protein